MSTYFGVYGVSHSFGGSRVLDEVSFEMNRGEILALLGPNGCGKSTLLKLISGVLPMQRSKESDTVSGIVRLLGIDFHGMGAISRARQIAYVPAELRAEFPLTALETVGLGRSSQGTGFFNRLTPGDVEAVESAMKSCFCWDLRDRDLHTLSSGERQLVSLARAIAQRAQVLLLDESLSRMDLNHQDDGIAFRSQLF